MEIGYRIGMHNRGHVKENTARSVTLPLTHKWCMSAFVSGVRACIYVYVPVLVSVPVPLPRHAPSDPDPTWPAPTRPDSNRDLVRIAGV